MDPERLRKVSEGVEASIAAKRAFFESCAPALVACAAEVAGALAAGGKVLLFGNGGSAADAQHIAAEFQVRLDRVRPALAALALGTDGSSLSAIANDLAWERMFARQIEALGRPGDVALAITTSGRSPNVVAGLEEAQARSMLTVGFLGRDGGPCRAKCHHALVVPVGSTQRIQETHILMGHLLAELVEDELHPAAP